MSMLRKCYTLFIQGGDEEKQCLNKKGVFEAIYRIQHKVP